MNKGQHKIDPSTHNKVIRELDELKESYQALERNFRLLSDHGISAILNELERLHYFYEKHKDCNKK